MKYKNYLLGIFTPRTKMRGTKGAEDARNLVFFVVNGPESFWEISCCIGTKSIDSTEALSLKINSSFEHGVCFSILPINCLQFCCVSKATVSTSCALVNDIIAPLFPCLLLFFGNRNYTEGEYTPIKTQYARELPWKRGRKWVWFIKSQRSDILPRKCYLVF